MILSGLIRKLRLIFLETSRNGYLEHVEQNGRESFSTSLSGWTYVITSEVHFNELHRNYI